MAVKKPPRRELQPRSAETRERLLDGAIECLIQRGYSGTTTTALCEVSGVSRGGQQHHFPTRESLIVTAVEHLAERVIEAVRRGAAEISPDQDPVLALFNLLWRGTSGRWFAAGYELWIASRTDAALRAVFVPAQDRAAKEILQLCRDVLPAEITSQDRFLFNLRSTLNLLHGLALTEFIRVDPEIERKTLELCRDILMGDRSAAPSPVQRNLEAENLRLKKLLAEAMLEIARLKEMADFPGTVTGR